MRMRWHLTVQAAAFKVRLHRKHLFLPVPVQFAGFFLYYSTSRNSTKRREGRGRALSKIVVAPSRPLNHDGNSNLANTTRQMNCSLFLFDYVTWKPNRPISSRSYEILLTSPFDYRTTCWNLRATTQPPTPFPNCWITAPIRHGAAYDSQRQRPTSNVYTSDDDYSLSLYFLFPLCPR